MGLAQLVADENRYGEQWVSLDECRQCQRAPREPLSPGDQSKECHQTYRASGQVELLQQSTVTEYQHDVEKSGSQPARVTRHIPASGALYQPQGSGVDNQHLY